MIKNIFLVIVFLFLSLIGIEDSNLKIYEVNGFIYLDVKANEEILNEEILNNLYYGIPLSMIFNISFVKDGWIYDETITTKELTKNLIFDRWSGYFLLKHNKYLFKTYNLNNLNESILSLKDIKLTEKKKINKGDNYYLKIKINLKYKKFNLYYQFLENLFTIFQKPKYDKRINISSESLY